MNHNEAVEQMLAEQYLLDELAPAAREAFEEHMFDCAECAFDLRAGSSFVREAKVQLPGIAAETNAKPVKFASKPSLWHSWWRPAFVAPVFATMLLVLVFQNVVTFPALREADDAIGTDQVNGALHDEAASMILLAYFLSPINQ